MNKKIYFIILFSILLLVSSIIALPNCARKDSFKEKMYPIDDGNFIVGGKTWGTLSFVKGVDVRAIANGLLPYTYYTFIYLGYKQGNTIIHNPICIRKRETTRNGGVKFNLANFDYSCMLNDNKIDIFAIVKSSDVNCKENQIINLNTEEMLFTFVER